jgi:tripartite-type tricarboxylate transporter receptor subunit TctC
MITKRRFFSLACAGSLAAIVPGMPQPARSQPVLSAARMLVGFAPGGLIDIVARLLVSEMKSYSPSFIVDNRPGAGGRVALGALKNSSADGSVMALAPAALIILYPHLYKTLSYDALKDFIPVTTACSFPLLLTVGPMVPDSVATLEGFIQWCRVNPKQATYGTPAAGSMPHFTGVALARVGGFEFVHLPYGGPNGVQDLAAGRIAATIYPIGTALPHVQSGTIRALATTGPERSPLLPGVRTVGEAGYPALEVVEWAGILVPAGTPGGTVNTLNSAISAVLKTDSFKSGLAKLSVDAGGESPSEFATLIRSDFDRWGPIVRASGFTLDD